MAWICANDFSDRYARVPACDGELLASGSEAPAVLLDIGSLVVEFDPNALMRVPARLVHYQRQARWQRSLTIYINPDRSLSVEAQQGRSRSYVRLSGWWTQTEGTAVVTYAWNAPARVGILTVECPETGSIVQQVFENPVTMFLDDAEEIGRALGHCTMDEAVTSAAISDRIEPIGPQPSIIAGTRIDTPDGPRPIERLQLGDMIITADGEERRLRWLVSHDLPAVGRHVPVRIAAPFLGLTQDLTVGLNQRLLIEGTEAEYLFGQEAVLVEAGQLLGRPGVTIAADAPTNRYFQLVLDEHSCVRMDGIWGETLYLGDLGRSRVQLATSLLAPLTATGLPRHRRMLQPILRNFETHSLLEAMSA